jgi:hypothetical protein
VYCFYIQQSTKQYTEGQTIQWPKEKVHTTIYKTIHRRTDNTMTKRKSTYNNPVGHCVVCPSVYCFVDCCMYFFFWSLYCLSFCVLFCRFTEGQTTQWPTEKVQITIYKTIHRRTDNTMTKRKSTYNNLLSAIVLSVLLCIVL